MLARKSTSQTVGGLGRETLTLSLEASPYPPQREATGKGKAVSGKEAAKSGANNLF